MVYIGTIPILTKFNIKYFFDIDFFYYLLMIYSTSFKYDE